MDAFLQESVGHQKVQVYLQRLYVWRFWLSAWMFAFPLALHPVIPGHIGQCGPQYLQMAAIAVSKLCSHPVDEFAEAAEQTLGP